MTTIDFEIDDGLIERFNAKVSKSGPIQQHMTTCCWVWTAATANGGYGKIGVKGKTINAPSVAWILGGGRRPSTDDVVMHECDNPPCVRFDHLRLGSRRDNMQDCVSKGRIRPPCLRGELHGRSKIKDSDKEVIALRRKNGERLWTIANDYGLTDVRVSQIAKEFSK